MVVSGFKKIERVVLYTTVWLLVSFHLSAQQTLNSFLQSDQQFFICVDFETKEIPENLRNFVNATADIIIAGNLDPKTIRCLREPHKFDEEKISKAQKEILALAKEKWMNPNRHLVIQSNIDDRIHAFNRDPHTLIPLTEKIGVFLEKQVEAHFRDMTVTEEDKKNRRNTIWGSLSPYELSFTDLEAYESLTNQLVSHIFKNGCNEYPLDVLNEVERELQFVFAHIFNTSSACSRDRESIARSDEINAQLHRDAGALSDFKKYLSFVEKQMTEGPSSAVQRLGGQRQYRGVAKLEGLLETPSSQDMWKRYQKQTVAPGSSRSLLTDDCRREINKNLQALLLPLYIESPESRYLANELYRYDRLMALSIQISGAYHAAIFQNGGASINKKAAKELETQFMSDCREIFRGYSQTEKVTLPTTFCENLIRMGGPTSSDYKVAQKKIVQMEAQRALLNRVAGNVFYDLEITNKNTGEKAVTQVVDNKKAQQMDWATLWEQNKGNPEFLKTWTEAYGDHRLPNGSRMHDIQFKKEEQSIRREMDSALGEWQKELESSRGQVLQWLRGKGPTVGTSGYNRTQELLAKAKKVGLSGDDLYKIESAMRKMADSEVHTIEGDLGVIDDLISELRYTWKAMAATAGVGAGGSVLRAVGTTARMGGLTRAGTGMVQSYEAVKKGTGTMLKWGAYEQLVTQEGKILFFDQSVGGASDEAARGMIGALSSSFSPHTLLLLGGPGLVGGIHQKLGQELSMMTGAYYSGAAVSAAAGGLDALDDKLTPEKRYEALIGGIAGAGMSLEFAVKAIKEPKPGGAPGADKKPRFLTEELSLLIEGRPAVVRLGQRIHLRRDLGERFSRVKTQLRERKETELADVLEKIEKNLTIEQVDAIEKAHTVGQRRLDELRETAKREGRKLTSDELKYTYREVIEKARGLVQEFPDPIERRALFQGLVGDAEVMMRRPEPEPEPEPERSRVVEKPVEKKPAKEKKAGVAAGEVEKAYDKAFQYFLDHSQEMTPQEKATLRQWRKTAQKAEFVEEVRKIQERLEKSVIVEEKAAGVAAGEVEKAYDKAFQYFLDHSQEMTPDEKTALRKWKNEGKKSKFVEELRKIQGKIQERLEESVIVEEKAAELPKESVPQEKPLIAERPVSDQPKDQPLEIVEARKGEEGVQNTLGLFDSKSSSVAQQKYEDFVRDYGKIKVGRKLVFKDKDGTLRKIEVMNDVLKNGPIYYIDLTDTSVRKIPTAISFDQMNEVRPFEEGERRAKVPKEPELAAVAFGRSDEQRLLAEREERKRRFREEISPENLITEANQYVSYTPEGASRPIAAEILTVREEGGKRQVRVIVRDDFGTKTHTLTPSELESGAIASPESALNVKMRYISEEKLFKRPSLNITLATNVSILKKDGIFLVKTKDGDIYKGKVKGIKWGWGGLSSQATYFKIGGETIDVGEITYIRPLIGN